MSIVEKKDYGPFKSYTGRLLTQGLFYEFIHQLAEDEKDKAIYTLKTEDYTDSAGRKFKSLYRLYLDECDPTEYQFANKYFYSWEQWSRLVNTRWFKPYITLWRKEVEIKLMALGLNKIKDIAVSGNKDALAACKFLVSGGWKHSKGRPTKEQVEQIAHELAEEHVNITEDAERLGLTVN